MSPSAQDPLLRLAEPQRDSDEEHSGLSSLLHSASDTCVCCLTAVDVKRAVQDIEILGWRLIGSASERL